MSAKADKRTIELITIGDELITGHIVDTNAAFIARHLTERGWEVRYRTSVGDNLPDMEEAFRAAMARARVIITTGGLGPTDDDLTRRALVKVFRRKLVFHEEIWQELQKRYAARGVEVPISNQSQALLPQGAMIFPNKHGSAVGICLSEHERVCISLPGVPHEMRQIVVDEVIPYLKRLDSGQALKVALLRTTGMVESILAERIKPNLSLKQGVRLAYLPSYTGVDLRVIAAGSDDAEASQKADEVVRQIEKAVGKYVYGYDTDSLAGVVGQLLFDNDRTLSIAESCTGGQLGMVITSVPGSSRYFKGGIIAYDNNVKLERLSVEESVIGETGPGAVSEECARQMAAGCRRAFETDFALSVTGIAGPDGGSEEKPVGTTFIGLSSTHTLSAKRFLFGREREVVRSRAVAAALEILRREILDID